MFEQKTTDGYVSVKLSANSFNDENYVVRVPRDKVDLDNIVSEIAAGYPSLDPYVIIHSAELLKEQILKFLQQGKAVDILELGTMYLGTTGTVSRDNPQVSDLPGLTLKFTPSSSAKEKISALSANSFMISDPAPQISEIMSLYTMADDGVVYTNQPLRLAGGNLKIAPGEADNGIYFVPPNSDGEPSANEGAWIAVDLGTLIRNTSKTLEFYVPTTLSSGDSYFIAVKSTHLSSGKTRQAPVIGYSAEAVTVAS